MTTINALSTRKKTPCAGKVPKQACDPQCRRFNSQDSNDRNNLPNFKDGLVHMYKAPLHTKLQIACSLKNLFH